MGWARCTSTRDLPDRDVGERVLPAALAQHPDRRARFEREAKVPAALNHPNIAAIYGVEDRAIVMELVEGPTLADRIAAGAMPVEECLKIATQIAGRPRSRSRKRVVHRDLKPANVVRFERTALSRSWILDWPQQFSQHSRGRAKARILRR